MNKPDKAPERWQQIPQPALPRGEPPAAVENAWTLKEMALRHIWQLAGKIWTDHNIHDPGITALETLCFAVSDLGYRCRQPVADLLADPPRAAGDPAPPPQFFTAREILTVSPTTALDFRKLMIDCDGIKNAWIKPSGGQEVPIYLDRELGALSLVAPVPVGANSDPDRDIRLRGLHDIFLELEADPEQGGDLNDNRLLDEPIALSVDAGAGARPLSLRLDVGFGSFFDPSELNAAAPAAFQITAADEPYIVYQADWTPDGPDWLFAGADSIRIVEAKAPFAWLARDAVLPVLIEVTEAGDTRLFAVSLHLMDRARHHLGSAALLAALAAAAKGDGFSWLSALFGRYRERQMRRLVAVETVVRRLHAHRPLCGDFRKIFGMKVEEIALCADIELAPEARPEQVYAELRHQIEQFLAPDIRFKRLEDLLDAGVDPADIFDGPQLLHGFVDTESLNAIGRRTEINASDLINILMDIDGVLAVRELLMTSYLDNKPQAVDQRWSLPLTDDDRHVPRLAVRKSRFNFYKGFILCEPDPDEAAGLYEEAIARRERGKLAPGLYDLPVPKGSYRHPAGYTSIQRHFPLNYGIGDEGLAQSETPERQARAAQFKAYLMVFDQLLANYLAQLAHAKDLLGISGPPVQSYGVAPLYDAPGADRLIRDYVEAARADSTLSWDDYASKGELSGYAKALLALVDPEPQALRRKNRFLDHLLARFAEQFTDYALLLYGLDGAPRADGELLAAKAAFLADYPLVSRRRGTGFDYLDENRVWRPDNVSGLAARVARLVGMPVADRLELAPPPGPQVSFSKRVDDTWVFRLDLPAADGGPALAIASSAAAPGLPSQAAATERFYDMLRLMTEEIYAQAVATDSGEVRLEIRGPDGGYLADVSPLFADEAAARRGLGRLVDYIEATYFREGLHVVEHILLRPAGPDAALMPIGYERDCEDNRARFLDPYSCRVSIVLPALPRRFRSRALRRLVERTLRLEAPAHIALKICWVDHGQLRRFEAALRQWVRARAGLTPDRGLLEQKTNQLIGALNDLRSIYPAATLHDCDDPDRNTNPVVLDHTELGTFTEFEPAPPEED